MSAQMIDPLVQGAGPLRGLRILDLSTYVAGPSGAMTLAQLGADVIRVDPVGGATDTRRLPHDDKGQSLYWAGLNKAKRSVEIDLRSPQGRELVIEMLASGGSQGGILLTNAVGQSWLDYPILSARRPDLIEVHITGRRDGRPAVDYTVNCEVGLPWLTGPVDFARPSITYCRLGICSPGSMRRSGFWPPSESVWRAAWGNTSQSPLQMWRWRLWRTLALSPTSF